MSVGHSPNPGPYGHCRERAVSLKNASALSVMDAVQAGRVPRQASPSSSLSDSTVGPASLDHTDLSSCSQSTDSSSDTLVAPDSDAESVESILFDEKTDTFVASPGSVGLYGERTQRSLRRNENVSQVELYTRPRKGEPDQCPPLGESKPVRRRKRSQRQRTRDAKRKVKTIPDRRSLRNVPLVGSSLPFSPKGCPHGEAHGAVQHFHDSLRRNCKTDVTTASESPGDMSPGSQVYSSIPENHTAPN